MTGRQVTPGKVFSYKIMDSDMARALSTELHTRQIEISRINLSECPGASGPSLKPNRCVMPERYVQYAERIDSFTVYEDDIWVITFPNSGATWTQEMVWLIVHNLNYKAAREISLMNRAMVLEASAVTYIIKDSIELAENLPRPRHIVSHLPIALLPKQLWTVNPKIVYCARNPRDTAISYMHHYRHLHDYTGSNEMFLDGLLADQVLWCPQIQHTLDFWKHRFNALFIHFEQMKQDLMSVLKRACEYFDKRYTDAKLKELAAHLSFEAMKANPSTNHEEIFHELRILYGKTYEYEFLRKGQVGSYKEEMSEDYIKRFQELIDKKLAGTGFSYME